MKQHKQDSCAPWDQGVYQTGSTQPPKSRGALVAILLIAVIFLAGVISILSLMNIHLFSLLSTRPENHVPMSLSQDSNITAPSCSLGNDPTIADENIVAGCPGIGISGEPLSPLYQRYYRLPSGMFIKEVAEGSNAALQGVEPGDILISLGGQSVTSNEDLDNFLCTCQVGDTVDAVIYRNKARHTIQLTVEEAMD